MCSTRTLPAPARAPATAIAPRTGHRWPPPPPTRAAAISPSSPATTAPCSGPIRASRCTGGPRTRSRATPPATASRTCGAWADPEMRDRRDLIEHLPRLRRYARALTSDRSRADDLVQDTLERALAKLDLWQPGSDLRAWLFTLMHNLFVNQIRGRRLAETTLEDALDESVNGGQLEALAAHDIHDALARLPSEQREVLLLVGLEQFGYAEAALVLGVPTGTVMSRLSRARERMRQMLADQPAIKLKVVEWAREAQA